MKYFFSFIILLFVIGTIAQSPIKIKQIPSSDSVILWYDSVKKYTHSVVIFFDFEVIYPSPQTQWVAYCSYRLMDEFAPGGRYGGWSSTPFELRFGDTLVYPDLWRSIDLPDTCYYRVFTLHSLQPESDIQDSLVTYIQQINTNKKTSFPIGTLQEFKAKHPQLTDRLLETDSVEFEVYERPWNCVDFIALPIEY